jgi:G3E family GTPase
MIYRNIRTNLIIGFLGVGKTTAIRHLLSQVPDGEQWGVLVNEFGEIGIDGALLEADGIAVQEVAGGCLCCVASMGLKVGLNRLIKDYNPDRILIEPTGLGHPAQIIDQLITEPFNQILTLGATIGLVDARQLSDSRYREHPTYQDQIYLADVLVASKADLYDEEDRLAFEQLARTIEPPKQHLAIIERGRLQEAWLDFPRNDNRKALFPEAHRFIQQAQVNEHDHDHGHNHQSKRDWLRIENSGDGFYGCGWLINKEHVFNKCILERLKSIEADRVKGTIRTEDGWLAFNLTAGEKNISKIKERNDSRLEIIHSQMLDWQAIDQGLLKLRE